MREYYKKIKAIEFGMLSPELVKKMASVKVVTPELYDKEGYPVDGGLMDIRLGVIDPGLRCKTCGGKLKECNGHFGYIELARPLLHIKYIDMVLAFLRATCRECGEILLDEKKIKKKENVITKSEMKKHIRSLITSARNVKKCPHCQAKQYSVKIEKPSTFLENDKKLSIIEIKLRLEKISEFTVSLIGLDPSKARPEWAILEILPVPPVTIRPSITLETGERSEDDLTHKLSDIVRINQRLFENINAGAPEVIVEDLWDLLQYHVTTYFDNEISQVPPARHRSGQALKTLSERIKSKEGRFRNNLVGKRVNYAARTVISPDPKLELNEVGIPKEVAMELTIPERVTEWNLKRMKKFVENGPEKYPGSNYVIRPDNKKKKITEETQEQLLEELQPGYQVERHLMDNDIAIFNRQPSLHRMSIMGHRIKVLPGKSFRLNPAVCNPYNADFDGDEMNLHIPQIEEARVEVEMLMDVKNQIITPKNGLNIIGCDTDSVTGNYLLTKELEYNREDAIEILYSIGVNKPEKFLNLKNKVKGIEIFSMLLPSDFDFIGITKLKEELVIKNGNIIKGYIDNNTIGNEKGTLIRAVFAKYNQETGIEILGQIFRLGIEILLREGFSISSTNVDLPEHVKEKNIEIISNAEKKVLQYIEQYNNGELEPLPGLALEETVEIKIMEILNKSRNKVGQLIAENVNQSNPVVIMANSGAKGNIINLAQMAACVGQQALRGKRIANGYKDRVLTIFSRGDLQPSSKGYIKRGYRDGLIPSEFFMHAMTGRDSLMDTALRTPKSGYLYRRLSSALQDLRVEYDYSVRDGKGNIIQFQYGEDSLDVSKTWGGKINVERIAKEVVGVDKNVT
ncbi:DNA-directed RNA polymerase subunit A' [Candidatus Woesearchaeota archaeon]|nr:DNA-directed RNA polymerase subunit A' [Candidatus Woesearchaeota archaeon]